MNKSREAMGEIERAIADLEEVLAGVGGGGVPARFVEGHGLESRRFRFNWDGGALKLDFDLPCWRILADEGARRADGAEIASACRMGVLLISALAAGGLLRAEDGEAELSASCREGGARYELRDAGGEILDAGGWSVLAARLEGVFAQDHADSADVMVIFP